MHDVSLTPTTVTVTWEGSGQLQATPALSDSPDWRNVDSTVEMDPETGEFRTTFPRPASNLLFRVLAPDATVDCAECATGGG